MEGRKGGNEKKKYGSIPLKNKVTLPEDTEDHYFEKYLLKEAKPLESFWLIFVIQLKKIGTFENKKLSVICENSINNMQSLDHLLWVTCHAVRTLK